MEYNNDKSYDYFDGAFYPGYDRIKTKGIISRLFLAVFCYTLISYTVVFLAEIITFLFAGRDNAISILKNPYYIFSVQVLSMYVIALPFFVLICRTGKTKLSAERIAAIKNEKRKSEMKIDELVILFFISVAVMIFGGMISNAFTSFLSSILGHNIDNTTEELIENSPIWLVIAVAVIIGPIVEEFIFRKIFIDTLSEFGRGYSIILSSVAFGVFHGNFSQVLYATLLGFILGYIYVKSGRLLYSVLMHVALNFFGTVPTLLVSDSIKKLTDASLGGAAGSVSFDYFSDAMNVLGVIFLQYGFAIAGVILLCCFLFKRKYKIPFAKEMYIPHRELINLTLINPGMIAFLAVTVLQFVLSVL